MSNDANEVNNATVTTQEKKQTGSSDTRDTVFIGKNLKMDELEMFQLLR